MLIAILAASLVLSGCAELSRTHSMIEPYVGKTIDRFMTERTFAPLIVTPLADGGAVYAFNGGPGGEHCVFYIVTDAKRVISKYRFEHC